MESNKIELEHVDELYVIILILSITIRNSKNTFTKQNRYKDKSASELSQYLVTTVGVAGVQGDNFYRCSDDGQKLDKKVLKKIDKSLCFASKIKIIFHFSVRID